MDSMIVKCPSLRGDETFEEFSADEVREVAASGNNIVLLLATKCPRSLAIVSLLSPYGHVLDIRQENQATAAVSESICSHSSLMICAVGQKCQGLQPQLG
jgi:hypothetical protein